jgi:hypothetical protein
MVSLLKANQAYTVCISVCIEPVTRYDCCCLQVFVVFLCHTPAHHPCTQPQPRSKASPLTTALNLRHQ